MAAARDGLGGGAVLPEAGCSAPVQPSFWGVHSRSTRLPDGGDLRSRRLTAALVAYCAVVNPVAAQQLAPRELHDRIVEAMVSTSRLASAADTFVSWTERGPVLYHLVTRSTDSIVVGMQRNDPLVGVATVRFVERRIRSASVQWSERGETQRSVTVEVDGETVVVTDTARRVFPRPTGVWAIADYGMDDLLVEVLRSLETDREYPVSVFRPYGGRWDSLVVRLSHRKGGLEIQVVAAPDDTSRFIVADDGTLVQELRSKYPTNERRPLEGTRAFALYSQLRVPDRR